MKRKSQLDNLLGEVEILERYKEDLENAKRLTPDIQEAVRSYALFRNRPDIQNGVSKQNLTPRQYEAFLWVHNLGFSEQITAKVTGVTQQAVSGLLNRLYKKYPELSPKIQHENNAEIKRSKHEMAKAAKATKPSGKAGEAGSDEAGLNTGNYPDTEGGVSMIARLFGDRRYDGKDRFYKNPFHIPGKTKWPKNEYNTKLTDDEKEKLKTWIDQLKKK